MDYDDNDFQSQNLHLAGEGSNKYPPVLQPYALPRFDFDDSLHGHLRYDSLVETEVFLGIESNEDNQWIEDFSRGSSSIVFSSSAAESCAISRHNNVWSEATSSESVEMLLKSVGQDELIPRQNIVKESDACDELGCIIKQMEPILKHDQSSPSKVEDVNLQPTLLPDETPVKFSGLKEDVGGEQPLVKDASQTREGESSVDGGFSNLDPGPAGGKGGIILTQGNEFEDAECAVVDQSEVETVVSEPVGDRTQGDSLTSRIQFDNMVPSVQSVGTGISNLNSQGALPLPLKNEAFDSLQNNNGESRGECVVSAEAQMDDQSRDGNLVATGAPHLDNSLSLAFKVESMEEGNINNVRESSDMILKGVSDFHMMEGCSGSVCSVIPAQASEHEVVVLCKDSEFGDQSKEIAHRASSGALGQDLEVSNISVGTSTSAVEPNMDSIVQITSGPSSFVEEEDVPQSDCQLYTEILGSKPEVSLSSLEDNKASKGVDGSSNSYEGGSSSLNVACSSPELHGETHAAGTSEGVYDAYAVCRAELTKTVDNNVVSGQSDIHKCNEDVSVGAKESTGLSSDCSNMGCKVGVSLIIDKGVASNSSDICVGGSMKELIDSKSESDATAGDKSDGLALPLGIGASTGAVINWQEVQMSPLPAVGFTSSDKVEETAARISSEAGLSNRKISSNVTTELGPVSESEKGASCGTDGQLLCEKVDQSLSVVDTSSTGSQSEPKTALHNEVRHDSTQEIEVSPVAGDSTGRETEGAEVQVISGQHEVVTAEENHENAVSKVSDGETILKNDEMPTKPATLPLEEPCSDTGQNDQQDNNTTVLAGDKNSGQIATPCTGGDGFKVGGSFSSSPSSGSCVKSHVLESGGCCAEFDNPSASPTVIRTSELPQSESGKEEVKKSRDQNIPVSMGIDSPDPKGNDASDGERSFTFEVTQLADFSEKEAGKNWQPFATLQASKVSSIVGGSSSTSGLVKVDAKNSQDISHGGLQVSDREIIRGAPKGTPDRKIRRTSGKATGKESAKKGNAAKETTPKQSKSGDRKSNMSLSSSGIGQLLQSNEMQRYGHVETSSIKPFGVLPTSSSSLPDLNTSASSSIVYQQPFTDLQQVQLRAQIFVYGALIQGTAPDEAYMISAFGGLDGGRSIWENAFRTCIERLHGQKSHHINPETPLQSRSGARAPDQTSKQSALQSKVTFSPVGRASSKSTHTVVSPIIPLSSPIWSITTPCDTFQSSGMPRGAVMDYQPVLSPSHSHQTPPIKNFVGYNTSWISPAPFRGPWAAPAQTSAFDTGARFSALPITETVRLTPVKDHSVPQSSGGKHVSQGPVSQSGSPAGVIAGTSLIDPKKATVAPGQHSTESKPRKRKKIPVSQEPGQIILHSQSQTVPVSASAVASQSPTSVSITTPVNLVLKASSEKFFSSPSPLNLSDYLRKGDWDAEQRAVLSEETLGKLKEAKMQAEDAAALAAIAISHCQEMWNQMDKQKICGMEPDVETRLTSAAVAIAAAAAVAKAAAAAANVASNAALQAKMMADEALVSSGYGSSAQGNGISTPDGVKNLARATPASILKGEDATNSSTSIIVAAREAARRRVEAATAASKRAENMDAIVKAAELAAEAVSQAGKIVAMGDPLPLRELVEAGQDGYWKVPHAPPELVGKSNDSNRDQLNLVSIGEGPDTSAKHFKEISSDKKEKQVTNPGTSTSQRDMPRELEDHVKLVDCFSGSIAASGKNLKGQKGCKGSDLAKTVAVVSESESGSKSSTATQVENEKATETSNQNDIREGSHVEVFKDGVGFRTAWYSANVLSLKDGKAYVCYPELSSEKGVERLKEWVAIEGEGDEVPKIRTARPITVMPFEGTRKRRRAAMADYTWSVGDRVDAWIQDSWWEGVITEKSKKDETTLTVHFPAQGETSSVRAWHLRPSLLWKNGKWIEWSSSKENNSSSHQGDTPHEKRPRLGSPAGEVKGKDTISKSADVLESGKPREPGLLDLSGSEKTFNIGKSIGVENKPDSLRMIRTGLQKEGSRVIFGVPKPGKKRKFMEVSKHYVADQSSKIREPNDSVKFAKYLIPQGSGSRGWKNTSKSEPKEKRMAVSKPKITKSGKPQTVSGRTIPQKGDLLRAAVSAPDDDAITDSAAKIKDSVSHVENTSGKHNPREFQSFSSNEGAAEGPILFSSVGVSSGAPSSKKISSSNTKSERASKGKLAPAVGKLAKIEEGKVFSGNSAKLTPEVVEQPRRSNRRIQPTSRLLEGLQSSLIISKIPSVSHDRGHKSQNRTTPRGNNHG